MNSKAAVLMHLSMVCPTSHTWGRGGERTGRCSPNSCPRGRELLIAFAILNLLTFVPDHEAEMDGTKKVLVQLGSYNQVVAVDGGSRSE